MKISSLSMYYVAVIPVGKSRGMKNLQLLDCHVTVDAVTHSQVEIERETEPTKSQAAPTRWTIPFRTFLAILRLHCR
jgi:hypothetical protein